MHNSFGNLQKIKVYGFIYKFLNIIYFSGIFFTKKVVLNIYANALQTKTLEMLTSCITFKADFSNKDKLDVH